MPQLFCEDALAAPVQPYEMVIAKELLAPAVNARHAANKFLDHMDEINCDAIAKVLVAKHALLVAIDPCFKVEEAFWVSLRGDLGLHTARQRIVAVFPKAT